MRFKKAARIPLRISICIIEHEMPLTLYQTYRINLRSGKKKQDTGKMKN